MNGAVCEAQWDLSSALGVRAGTYSRCSSRSLVSKTSASAERAVTLAKKKNRSDDRSALRYGYYRDPMVISVKDCLFLLFPGINYLFVIV